MKFSLSIKRINEAVHSLFTHSPLELIVCCIFAAISLITGDDYTEQLAHFPLYFAVCVIANNLFVKKRQYYYIVSIAAMLLLLIPNIDCSTITLRFAMANIIAVLGVLVSRAKVRDDEPFAASTVTTLYDAALSIITGIVTFIIIGLTLQSVQYLFGIETNLFRYGYQWSIFIIAPMTFCALSNSHSESIKSETSPFLRNVARFIVTPALIIYTIILYAYAAKVFISGTLPEGGVAWMIIGFYAAALFGYITHLWAPFKGYNWFYRYFSYISIPLLVLFWWGVCYRIGAYSFTESRVYLVIAGTIITLTSVLLATRRRDSLCITACITMVALAVFSFIPYISAKDLGLKAQAQRLEMYMDMLGVRDSEGHFKAYNKTIVDSKAYEIKELKAAYDYLQQNGDAIEVSEKYKPLKNKDENILEVKTNSYEHYYLNLARDESVPASCEGYPYFYGDVYSYGSKKLKLEETANRVVLVNDDRKLMDEPIDVARIENAEATCKQKGLNESQENVFTYKNDSVCVVVSRYESEKAGMITPTSAYVLSRKKLNIE